MSFTVTPQTFDYNNLFNPVELGAAFDKAQAYKEAAVVQAKSLIEQGLYDTKAMLALNAGAQDKTGGVTDLSGVLGAVGSLGSSLAENFMRNKALKDVFQGADLIGKTDAQDFMANDFLSGLSPVVDVPGVQGIGIAAGRFAG